MNPSQPVFLVRRTAWLLGELKDDLQRSHQLSQSAFEMLVQLMVGHQDVMVKLTCVKTLTALIDNSQFSQRTFINCASQCCTGLLELLNSLENVTNVGIVITCLTMI